jgi:DNA-binding GntR family transcriptional regulator
MPRPKTISHKAKTDLLRYLSGHGVGFILPPEVRLASELGISRGLLRDLLSVAEEQQIVILRAKQRHLARVVRDEDFGNGEAVPAPAATLENAFLRLIRNGDVRPRTRFSETQLMKATSVSASTAREFLISLSKFGMVEKLSSGGWILHGFDRKYAIEISDFRTMTEMAAIRRIRQIGLDQSQIDELDHFIHLHETFALSTTFDPSAWAMLDQKLHEWLIAFMDNRFVAGLADGIALISLMHFGSDPGPATDRRIKTALAEHREILRELRARHFDAAYDSIAKHMTTERDALLNAIARRQTSLTSASEGDAEVSAEFATDF